MLFLVNTLRRLSSGKMRATKSRNRRPNDSDMEANFPKSPARKPNQMTLFRTLKTDLPDH